MKPLSIFLSAAAVLIVWGCHKSNSSGNASGYWMVGAQRNTVGYTTRKDSAGVVILTASQTSQLITLPITNTIRVWFGSLPADSGTYSILPLNDYGWPLILPGKNQIGVTGTQLYHSQFPECDGPMIFYGSGIKDVSVWPYLQDSATVKVINGKITVNIPRTIAGALVPCGWDSLWVVGTIREN